jgi:hypothetical protein
MPHRFRRFFSLLAVAAVVMLGAITGATPAQAAPTACPSNFFCLYHWTNYDGGRWQIASTGLTRDECWNLSNSRYTDGDVVDMSSASAINNTTNEISGKIILYSEPGCKGATTEEWNETKLRTNSPRSIPNLNDIGWYHEVRSIQIKTGFSSAATQSPPVSAAVDLNCPNGNVCLFDWLNWEHGKWQTNVENWPAGTCWNLSGSTFNNGTNVNDSATSFWDLSNNQNRKLTVYDWVDCNAGGGRFTIDLGLHQPVAHMGIWLERVSSIRIS